jgi:hypothetical protein
MGLVRTDRPSVALRPHGTGLRSELLQPVTHFSSACALTKRRQECRQIIADMHGDFRVGKHTPDGTRQVSIAHFRNPAPLRIIDGEGERGPEYGVRLFEKPATGEIDVAELSADEAARAAEQLFHWPTQYPRVGAFKTLNYLLP